MTDRFYNLQHLLIGSVILFLDEQIRLCQANANLAPDEWLETFYVEAWATYIAFKRQLIDYFYSDTLDIDT